MFAKEWDKKGVRVVNTGKGRYEVRYGSVEIGRVYRMRDKTYRAIVDFFFRDASSRKKAVDSLIKRYEDTQ